MFAFAVTASMIATVLVHGFDGDLDGVFVVWLRNLLDVGPPPLHEFCSGPR